MIAPEEEPDVCMVTIRKVDFNMDKRVNKKNKEELQQYLMWRRRGSVVLAKRGKGAKYNRQKIKVKNYTWE